jgi:heme-degrading monooxygenase HmoA
VREEYVALANRMNELARTIPGYVSHKDFYANDGERVAVVEFAHEEGQRAWQTNPEHRTAQKQACEKYYTSTTFRFAGSSASRNSSCPEKRRHRLDPRS